MSGTAIVMMIVAIVLVWGGLLLALVNIKRSPEEVDELDDPADGTSQAADTSATSATEGAVTSGAREQGVTTTPHGQVPEPYTDPAGPGPRG